MQAMQNAIRWKDVRAAAEYLGCSKSFLDKDRITGLFKIPFTRLGKKVIYDARDLDDYLESRKHRWQDGEVA